MSNVYVPEEGDWRTKAQRLNGYATCCAYVNIICLAADLFFIKLVVPISAYSL